MVILATAPKPDYAGVLAIIAQLARLLYAKRSTMTVAEQAKAIGISATTLKAIDAGRTPTLATLLLCLKYLAR